MLWDSMVCYCFGSPGRSLLLHSKLLQKDIEVCVFKIKLLWLTLLTHIHSMYMLPDPLFCISGILITVHINVCRHSFLGSWKDSALLLCPPFMNISQRRYLDLWQLELFRNPIASLGKMNGNWISVNEPIMQVMYICVFH